MSHCPEQFAVKLNEMERAYDRLQGRMELFEHISPENLHTEMEQIRSACQAYDILLSNAIQKSRTPLISQLAQAQLRYNQTAQAIMENAVREYSSTDAQAEAAAICAEFAMDQAICGMNHALLAALLATEKQHTENETSREEMK